MLRRHALVLWCDVTQLAGPARRFTLGTGLQRLRVRQPPSPGGSVSLSHCCLAPRPSAGITQQLRVPQPSLPGTTSLSCHCPAAPCPSTVIAWWLLFPQLPSPKLVSNPLCLSGDGGHGSTGLLFQRVCWKPGYNDCRSVMKHHIKILCAA